MNTAEVQIPETDEVFADLLNEQFGDNGLIGSVVKGTIIKINPDFVTVDVGLKSEGRIPVREFGQNPELKVGDTVEVYVDRYEDREGNIVLSREKARREEVWQDLEKAMNANERINGVIFGRVKGGFTVDLNGAIAFLPGSQIDIRPIRDITPLMGISQPFQILKMDKVRGNIVVSRRVVLEETRAESRAELIDAIKEGSVLDGVVKNITDYGAFIDLGGVDGLIHISEMSWGRISNPKEVLSEGDTVEVVVLDVDKEKSKISLSLKDVTPNPWTMAAEKYVVGSVVEGKVVRMVPFGAFIELEPGVDGLVHISQIANKRVEKPEDELKIGETIKVKVIDVNAEQKKISLSKKEAEAPVEEATEE